MKIIASSLLVLGLLAIQVSEANAVVCAAGAYHAGCASRSWARSCAVPLARSAWLGPTAALSCGRLMAPASACTDGSRVGVRVCR